jgi:PAS domain S-box-containing protein
MIRPLRILHLEDDPEYSDLVAAQLDQEGLDTELHRVETREEFESAIAREAFDIILADYLLHDFDGVEALGIAREKCPNTPFLIVSGTIQEHVASESLRSGATDYVMKHWPERLVPAVRRAAHEAEEKAGRRLAETELHRRETYFRALTENSLDVLSILDSKGYFGYNSPSVEGVLGYSPQELTGVCAFSLVHPEDIHAVLTAFEQALESPEQTIRIEFRVKHRDGAWRHVEAIGQNRLHDPEIAGLVLNTRDVSDRKRAEAQLREREAQEAALSRLGHDLNTATTAREAAEIIQAVTDEVFDWDVFVLDLYSAAEDRVYMVVGIDTDREGRRFDATVTEAQGVSPSGLGRKVLEQGAQLVLREEPLEMPGDTLPIGDVTRPSASLMLAPIRSGMRVIGILSVQSYAVGAYDASELTMLQTLADHCGGALERIRAEQALRDSEVRFRDLFQASPDPIFVEDCEGTVLDVNPAACALHGYAREQLVGANVAELVPPHWREAMVRDFGELLTGSLRQLEGASLTGDGREVPVEVRASPIDYAGKQAVLLHVRDISERKAAEAAVRGSEMLFHSVWENSVEGMRLTDEQGTIVAVNEAYCRLAGLPREQLEGQFFSSAYAESENPAGMLEDYRAAFQLRGIERSIKKRLTLHDGRVVMLEGSNSFVELQGQAPMLLTLFRDATRQDQLEEQLRQAQKMEAIGQLAGGIAHDFNNILTVIHGHASLLLASGAVSGGSARCAQQIVEAADRATALTRQLLTFGRRHVMQPRRMDLNEAIGNMTQMLERLLGEDIALQLNYCPDPAIVEADASMMEQVLLNLAVNARDAMPQGGVLTLGVASVTVDADHVSRFPEGKEGQFICLSAADSGCGIELGNLPHIFEPFFTTKAVGKGTGLGLATVYGIVNQHHGWIEVESEPGFGTLFRVFLPPCDEAIDDVAEPVSELAPRGGKETILVVEDEEAVRELVCGLLSGLGYQILQAESGVKALELWDSCKDQVDLVLTDLVMPERLNGRELAEKLWEERPELKVIFTSGYSAEVVGRDFVVGEEMNYLQKPYHPNVLASVVRECLDAVN